MVRPIIFSNKSPYYDKPFFIEQWKVIDSTVVCGADGSREVSNYGEVRFTKTKQPVYIQRSKRKTSNKYDLAINLPLFINGVHFTKRMAISRLVMMAFAPVAGMEYLEIDHRDGNTEKNWITNLSWCTHAENVRFAYMNGYCKNSLGESRHLSLSPEKLDKICNLIRSGKTYNEIANSAGVSYQTVYRIHSGDIYADYRDKYRLWEIPKPVERETLSEETIDNICSMIVNGIPSKTIAKELDIPTSTISAIKIGRLYPEKYKQYDLGRFNNRDTTRLTKEEKIKMVKFVKENENKYESVNDLYRDALRFVGMEVPDKLDAKTRQFVYYTVKSLSIDEDK